jgi:hypothetical protein
MILGLIQPLTEMRIKDLPCGKARPAHMAETLPPFVSRLFRNVGSSVSYNHVGFHGLLQG